MSQSPNINKITNTNIDSQIESPTFLDNVSTKMSNILSVEISLKREIVTLKEKIKDLEQLNRTYLLKIIDLTKSRNILLEQQLINKRLNEELKIKQEIIEKLQMDILKEEKDKKEEQRIIENKFNAQLIYYKRLHDTGVVKENAASSIIKLNETQHNCIVQLENKIDEIKMLYEKKIKDIELGHENRYSKLKKQMMEFLKNTQKNMAKNNEENLELNSKLTVLYKNQMLNELENQSHQIEELLKEREKLNKELYVLKQELNIHKKVEEIIKTKNSKYLNLINKINIKFNKLKEGEEKLENNIKNDDNKNDIGKASSIKNIQNSIKNEIYKKNEYNNEVYNNLFKAIILLCNEVLEKLKNKKITKIHKSNLFSEKFDFYNLDSNQKFELLIEIIKKIFSFINIDEKNDLEILNIKKKIELIKTTDNYLSKRDSPINNYKTKIKYNKLINVINKKSKSNNNLNINKKDLPNIKHIKNYYFNKVIFSKTYKNKITNELITSFRVKSPNPLIRFIHLNKDKNIEDKKNNTFYRGKRINL